MIDYNYAFVKKKYIHSIAYTIPVWLLVASVLCFISFVQNRLDLLFVIVIYVLCTFVSLTIVYVKTKSKANSKLFINNGIINYVDVIDIGYTRMLNYKYKAYHYLIYDINCVVVEKNDIVLEGNIKKITITKFNTLSECGEQRINRVVIPNFFEDRERFLESVNKSMGGNKNG